MVRRPAQILNLAPGKYRCCDERYTHNIESVQGQFHPTKMLSVNAGVLIPIKWLVEAKVQQNRAERVRKERDQPNNDEKRGNRLRMALT